jgi:hypothetical protein
LNVFDEKKIGKDWFSRKDRKDAKGKQGARGSTGRFYDYFAANSKKYW